MSHGEDRKPDGELADGELEDGEARHEAAAPLAVTWRLRRVLVAFDASPASTAAAETAAGLAARLEAELAGLFVVDADLALLAELPAVLEVGSFSALPSARGSSDVERRLRVQAQRAQRLFEATAARAAVRTSFRVVRGRVSEEVLTAAGAGELLSLGRIGTSSLSRLGSLARAALAHGRGPLLLLPPGGRLEPPVVVAFSDTAEGHSALAAATRLPAVSGRGTERATGRRAQRTTTGGDLVVLLPAVDDAETNRLRILAGAVLAAHGRRARVRRADPDDRHALLHAVAAERAHALVLPGHSALAASDEIESVVEELSCAVLLVR